MPTAFRNGGTIDATMTPHEGRWIARALIAGADILGSQEGDPRNREIASMARTFADEIERAISRR